MSLARFEPIRVGQLQNDINRLFSNWEDSQYSSGATAGWMPSTDIHEYGDRFELFVDLPGVNVDDVALTLDNGVLSITGERKELSVNTDEKQVQRRSERGLGQFHRRFILPDTVDADTVNAKTENGVLSIVIHKQAKAQPRRIEISAAA